MHALAPGDVFDRYVIEAPLGEGGMGRVYRARDQRLGRVVALKIVRASAEGDTSGAARMVREARAAAALNHPNIVALFDAGEHDGCAYLAMELVPGRSLRAYVGDASVPMATRVAWMRDVARALAAAHATGLVHRDVKPENVMVRDDGVVKVCDFGVARRVADRGATTGDTITQDGALVGTPLYMAPEQLAGDSFDQRADQFAWGLVAYELVTGARPWALSDLRAVAAILARPVPPPRERAPDVPPHVDATILRALQKRPDDRFASMDALGAALDGTISATTTGPAPPRSHDAPGEATERHPTTGAGPSGARVTTLTLAALGVAAIGAAAIALGGQQLRASTASAPDAAIAESAPDAGAPMIETRRSIAVASIREPDGRPDNAWRATAVSELLGAELAAGGRVRVVQGDRVARAKLDLGLSDAGALTPEQLAKMRADLDVDLLVVGELGESDAGDGVALHVTVIDPKTGGVVASAHESSPAADLFPLAARAATRLRASLRIDEPTEAQRAGVATSLPSSAQAARLYAQAITEQRAFRDARAAELYAEVAKVEPRFALAYAHASDAYVRSGREEAGREAAKKALDLSADLPREERLWIEATYHAAMDEWSEAARAYEALATFFPDDVEYVVNHLLALSFSDHAQDALAEVARVRRLPPAVSDDPRIDYEESRAAHLAGDYPRCLRAALECKRRATARGAKSVAARVAFMEGVARMRLGHPDEAIAALEEGRALARSIGDTNALNVLAGPLADDYVSRAEIDRARAVLQESRAALLAAGTVYWATSQSEQLGWFDAQQGKVTEGRRAVEDAVAFYRRFNRLHALGGSLPNLAELLARCDDPTAGERVANEALALAKQTSRTSTEANAEYALAWVARARGDREAERVHVERSLAAWQAANRASGKANSRAMIGERAWIDGDLAAARRELEGAIKTLDDRGEKLNVAQWRVSLARVALDEGNAADAETNARAALAVALTAGAQPLRTQALAVLARARAAQGAEREADDLAREATSIVTSDHEATLYARIDAARARLASSPAAARAELAAVAVAATAAHRSDLASQARRALAPPSR